MEINHWLLTVVTFIKDLVIIIFKLVVKGDNVIVLDRHGADL
jgi:hypothetical protein